MFGQISPLDLSSPSTITIAPISPIINLVPVLVQTPSPKALRPHRVINLTINSTSPATTSINHLTLWAQRNIPSSTASIALAPSSPTKSLRDVASTALGCILSPIRSKMVDGGSSTSTKGLGARSKLTILTSGAQQRDRSAPTPGVKVNADVHLPWYLKLTNGQRTRKFQDIEWEWRQKNLELLKSDGEVVDSQWSRLKGPEISARNRYPNVDAFAKNRIRLKVKPGQCDYINASPIRLPISSGKIKKYIATQGPKENTVSDFWRMIYDHPSQNPVIVMLTQTVEANREKCFQYFPLTRSDSPMMIDDPIDPSFHLKLTLSSVRDDEGTKSQIRSFRLSSADGSRSKQVTHFLFEAWSDFSVPESGDREALLALVALAQKLSTTESGYEEEKIVHCSAGVGRSGSFIALDWLIEELKLGTFDDAPTIMPISPAQNTGRHRSSDSDERENEDRADPISDLVEKMRTQRMMMVQSDSQFTFLYDTLAELWLHRYNELHETSD